MYNMICIILHFFTEGQSKVDNAYHKKLVMYNKINKESINKIKNMLE